MRACEVCGRALTGRQRRFCSGTCRVRAHRTREREDRHHQATLLERVHDQLSAALAEDRLVAQIAVAARSNWRASAWLLERAYPERWAPGGEGWAPAAPVAPPRPTDPFAEVDELARRG
jgi:hypothetical protein